MGNGIGTKVQPRLKIIRDSAPKTIENCKKRRYKCLQNQSDQPAIVTIQQLALVPSQLKLRVVPLLPFVKVGIMWAVRLRSTGSLGQPHLNLGLTIGLACIITTGCISQMVFNLGFQIVERLARVCSIIRVYLFIILMEWS